MPKQCAARLARGLNLAKCLQAARRLGCRVEPVHRTGEIRFVHPRMLKCITVNGRRKDAPRELTSWMNRVASMLQGQTTE